MNTNNGETSLAVAIVQALDEGQRVATVIAAESPKLDKYNTSRRSFSVNDVELSIHGRLDLEQWGNSEPL